MSTISCKSTKSSSIPSTHNRHRGVEGLVVFIAGPSLLLMNINKNCKLFLRDIYLYDITACHYQILQKMNIDVSHVDPNDKLKRNTQIGLMMRDNPRLTSLLRNITISTVSEHLLKNDVKEDEIIIRQYDGVITTRPLNDTVGDLPLDFQKFFQSFLISSDRTRYIASDGSSVTIKGVSHRYKEMDKMLERIIQINFLSIPTIFKMMQKIKDDVLTSQNPLLYCIPQKEDQFTVFMKGLGEIDISKSMARLMDTEDIHRQRYFDFYLRPFTESICIEFL